MAKQDGVRRIDQRPKKTAYTAAAEPVLMSFDELTDVEVPNPNDIDIAVFDRSRRLWVSRPLPPHQVHFAMGTGMGIQPPPGPCNITGVAFTIFALRFASDGGCSGSFGPGSYGFTIPGGGGVVEYGGLDEEWGLGATMTISISDDAGDGTYLSVSVAIRLR